jgi:hypothetical protein
LNQFSQSRLEAGVAAHDFHFGPPDLNHIKKTDPLQ